MEAFAGHIQLAVKLLMGRVEGGFLVGDGLFFDGFFQDGLKFLGAQERRSLVRLGGSANAWIFPQCCRPVLQADRATRHGVLQEELRLFTQPPLEYPSGEPIFLD